MNHSVKEITPEPLTPGNFSPFGEVIFSSMDDSAPVVASLESRSLSFSADAAAQIMLLRFHKNTDKFSVLEQHKKVTQCFFPLSDTSFIMVVAAPTKDDDVPSPEDVRAFLVDGSTGILLWKRTWHSLLRYPVHAPHVDIAFVTDVDTQSEIEEQERQNMKMTRFVDYSDMHNVKFSIKGYD